MIVCRSGVIKTFFLQQGETIMSTQIDEAAEMEEVSEPFMEAVMKVSEAVTPMIQEKIAADGLLKSEGALAFSGVCQMLTLNALIELAEETECDPLDLVDSWANSFYEALDDGEDEIEDEEEEA